MSTSTSPSSLTERQRARSIHLDEENTQGPFIHMHKHVMWRFKEAETNFFCGCPMMGHRKFHVNTKKKTFECEEGQTLAQIGGPDRFRVSILETVQKPAEHSRGMTVL